MKFIHTGDLHIGKVLNGFNLLEDQKHIIKQIINLACVNKVDAVILSGDLYDRSVPTPESVITLDYLISELIDNHIKVLAINGNHDSPERLIFAKSIMAKQGYFIESTIDKELKYITMQDEFGDINFYFMPFIRNSENNSAQDSVESILNHADINKKNRNVIIAHHFFTDTGNLPGEFNNEESVCVGDIDNVDVSCFNMFDYSALGHIHRAMKIGEGNAYYSGSPLKYSIKEAKHSKSVYLVELCEKGNISIEKKVLNPLHDLRVIQGEINQLIQDAYTHTENNEDFIFAILTNKEEITEPLERLRSLYPNLMQVTVEKTENQFQNVNEMTIAQLFEKFYRYVTDTSLDCKSKAIMDEVINEVKWGDYC